MTKIPFHFKLTLNCEEDLHVGNGFSSSGLYDSGFACDSQGNPWIPQSTIAGMIEDSCRKLVNLSSKYPYAYIEELFRYALGTSLCITPLKLKTQNLKMITHASTAINSQTGTAKDHSLRAIECAPKGSQFQGELLGVASSEDVLNFLKEGIRLTRRIGGSRNRGLGAVRISIEECELTPILGAEVSENKGAAGYLLLKLRLKDGITIAKKKEAGQTLFSEDYIRAENILGAFRYFLRAHGDLEKNRHFKLLDDDSGLIFANAYPMGEGLLSEMNPFSIVPVPKTLQLAKKTERILDQHPDTLENLPHWYQPYTASSNLNHIKARDQWGKQTNPEIKYKSADGYLKWEGTNYSLIQTSLSRSLRNRVDLSLGSVKDDGLFVEEVLKDNSAFFTWIHFPSQTQKDAFLKTFEAWFSEKEPLALGIGRGRKAVCIEEYHWYQQELKHGEASESLRITLLSDLILYDSQGRSLKELTLEHLLNELNLNSLDVKWDSVQSSTVRDFMHAGGGFFGQREQVIEKGSTFKMTGDPEALKKIRTALKERRSIGEWSIYGHGQFILDLQFNIKSEMVKATVEQPELPKTSGQEHRLRLAQNFERDQKELFETKAFSVSKIQKLRAYASSCICDSEMEAAFDDLARKAKLKTENFWNAQNKDKEMLFDVLKKFFLAEKESSEELEGRTGLDALEDLLRYWITERELASDLEAELVEVGK